VTASTGEHIAMFLYCRTDSLVRGKSMGHQILAAMRAHSAPTRGTASWIVVSSPSAPTTFGGNPASSAEVNEMFFVPQDLEGAAGGDGGETRGHD